MVDVPVTVNTLLVDPAGLTITSTTQPVNNIMGSSFITTYTIGSFGRSNYGLYDCRVVSLTSTSAYISNSSTTSHSVRVTTGEMCVVHSYCM